VSQAACFLQQLRATGQGQSSSGTMPLGRMPWGRMYVSGAFGGARLVLRLGAVRVVHVDKCALHLVKRFHLAPMPAGQVIFLAVLLLSHRRRLPSARGRVRDRADSSQEAGQGPGHRALCCSMSAMSWPANPAHPGFSFLSGRASASLKLSPGRCQCGAAAARGRTLAHGHLRRQEHLPRSSAAVRHGQGGEHIFIVRHAVHAGRAWGRSARRAAGARAPPSPPGTARPSGTRGSRPPSAAAPPQAGSLVWRGRALPERHTWKVAEH